MPILTNILQKAGSKQPDQQRAKRSKSEKAPRSSKSTTGKKSSVAKKTSSAGTSLKKEQAHGAFGVIVRPHISEKSVDQARQGKYVFEVYPGVKSGQVASAVAKTYGVIVAKVNMVKVPSKKTRLRNRYSHTARSNKAIVTLKAGHSIEVLPQ